MNSEAFSCVPELSIVIPAYNASKHIIRTLSSLENQTVDLEKYRIIVVDDGSTDDTLDLCTQFASKYPNIQVIHQENAGVSSARNTGIAAATGKWLSFVDSDDYVEVGYVQTVITACQEAEYVVFDNFLEKNGCRVREKDWLRSFGDQSCSISQVLLWICDQRLNSPCDKRYSRELVLKKNIRFPENINMGEDLVFNFRYALQVQTVCIQTEAVYVYTENPEGLTSSRYTAARFVQMEQLYDLMQQLCCGSQSEEKCLEMLDRSFLRGIARCGGQLHRAGFSTCRIAEMFDESEMVRKVLASKVGSLKDLVRKILLDNHLYKLCAVLISAK